MIDLESKQIWFVTGAQQLYGEDALEQVAEHTRQIVTHLQQTACPLQLIAQPVSTNSESITTLCARANTDPHCAGLIFWMHTFSPAKMWLAGLQILSRPFAHLHTQFNRDIPWQRIDMDFMNLNQSAHGDREFGYMCTRLGLRRKVIVGHWQNPDVHRQVASWCRAAAAHHDAQQLKVARFGDNMRNVAVTEGDKVEAQRQMGYAVESFGVGDLAEAVNAVCQSDVDAIIEQYEQEYALQSTLRSGGQQRQALRDAGQIELGLRQFLREGGFHAFTDTFEDLHGLKQLPGLPVQRLMAEGIGFGAEGDWKTAALVRAVKVLGAGLEGGCSFMEDYTYHLDPNDPKVLGSHMLEVCSSIAQERPSCEVHPLSIGGKDDPVRLVFTARSGAAVNAGIADMGNHFRLVANQIETVQPDEATPHLPVARALWRPVPDFATAAAAWIHAGGPHHTAYSDAVTMQNLEDYAEIVGLEWLAIDEDTHLSTFKRLLNASNERL